MSLIRVGALLGDELGEIDRGRLAFALHADLVADLVDTGETMRANGLFEVEKIRDVSPHVIVSRAALARRRKDVFAFLETVEGMLAS